MGNRISWQQWVVVALVSAVCSLAGAWAVNVEMRLAQHVTVLAGRGERITAIEGQIARLQDQDRETREHLEEIKDILRRHDQATRPGR